MKVIVNGETLRDDHLLNKPKVNKIADGRVVPWFSEKELSWRLCYSPSFKDNYFHQRYRVVNGDAYFFAFDLSHIISEEGRFEIVVEHTGQQDVEIHQNPIIVQEVEVI
jgi:hypothetical protein